MKTATVTELPNCGLCEMKGRTEPAEYDGRTAIGQWAFMCQQHYDQYGVGLGTGKGQKLVLPTKQPDELIVKADDLCRKCAKDCLDDSWNKDTGRYRVLGDPIKIEVMLSMELYCEEVGE